MSVISQYLGSRESSGVDEAIDKLREEIKRADQHAEGLERKYAESMERQRKARSGRGRGHGRDAVSGEGGEEGGSSGTRTGENGLAKEYQKAIVERAKMRTLMKKIGVEDPATFVRGDLFRDPIQSSYEDNMNSIGRETVPARLVEDLPAGVQEAGLAFHRAFMLSVMISHLQRLSLRTELTHIATRSVTSAPPPASSRPRSPPSTPSPPPGPSSPSSTPPPAIALLPPRSPSPLPGSPFPSPHPASSPLPSRSPSLRPSFSPSPLPSSPFPSSSSSSSSSLHLASLERRGAERKENLYATQIAPTLALSQSLSLPPSLSTPPRSRSALSTLSSSFSSSLSSSLSSSPSSSLSPSLSLRRGQRRGSDAYRQHLVHLGKEKQRLGRRAEEQLRRSQALRSAHEEKRAAHSITAGDAMDVMFYLLGEK